MSAKANSKLDTFLDGPVAGQIAFPGRVVIRRGVMTLADYGSMAAEGFITVLAKPVCELELGGEVIARGEIEERDGEYFFRAREEESSE
jgi:hypothetical protein